MTARVLVVDDSAFTRKVLREVLAAAPGIEVVGTARDGLEALEKIELLRPDVVTLDLVMPELDGLGVLRALPRDDGAPRVVVVSISDAESALAVEAFQLGAVELVRKPTALASSQLREVSRELVAKVLAAAAARQRPWPRPDEVARPATPAPGPDAPWTRRVVVVGTSTGGPQAITRLLAALPGGLPAPVAIALHIPAGYTDSLAARLDEGSALTVREARDGLVLRPGMAALAPGGRHLTLERGPDGPVARLDAQPRESFYRPSVDALFQSAALAYGGDVLGVVLTGMGDDGLIGARAIRAAGGEVLAEAEASCVVYGMPRRVVEAGLAAAQVSIERMAEAIVRHGAPGR
ncbi:MAG: chemotaxis-specific protein-glutamate methyltransferase CheB [Planctomycetes bacterium]|nr:chemotaxis-specific protein-glutamate methyltransferase CheB [Planctomycetota bacterium]